MHYFESQLISQVKLIEENEQSIVFAGHYLYGDGASIPFGSILIAYCMSFIYYYEWKHWGFIAFAAFLIVVAIPFFVFKKKVLLDLDKQKVEVYTRSIFGSRKNIFSFKEARIKTESISIRMADDCGAVDLFLPDTIIRIHVSGHIRVAREMTKALIKRTGIKENREEG